MLSALLSGRSPQDASLCHVERLPGQNELLDDWPWWVPEQLVSALGVSGLSAPWPHQVEAAELAWSGRSVVIATGTST
ncbi:MAG: box helicase protein, partial [Pseudonocardiales bacterium]|nr:box helicase protein [Pseudonocardiales bacterium]